MAFPLEPSQLRAQQRAFCVATSENDLNSTVRIIKPLTSGLFFEAHNSKYFSGYRPSSPPIPIELSEIPGASAPISSGLYHKRHSSRITIRNAQLRRKSRIVTPAKQMDSLSVISSKVDSLEFGKPSMSAESLKKSEEPKKIKKNPLAMLFVKSDKSKSRHSDTDSTISHSTTTPSLSNTSGTLSDEGKFGDFYDDAFSEDSSLLEANSINDEVKTLDPGDASNYESDEIESLDSAFTDIEDDQILDGSLNIMYNYTVPDASVFSGDTGSATIQHQKKQEIPGEQEEPESDLKSISSPMPLSQRYKPLSFIKLRDIGCNKNVEAKSKLSSIIQTRHTSTNTNPLTFFSYGGADGAEGVRKSDVSVFLPPRTLPTLVKVPISGNMSVFDCIGYFLLKLTGMEDANTIENFSHNPNHWRLELTDDDGELYDSTFGVLDRVRPISSYNYPKYLALCRVEEPSELEKIERQTPLPIEFRQNLELFEKRDNNSTQDEINGFPPAEKWDTSAPNGRSVEIKVKNIPSTSKVITYFVASGMLVGDLLDLICRQYQVNPTNYRLSEYRVSSYGKWGNTSLSITRSAKEEGQYFPLKNSEALSDIEVDHYKMEPIMRSTVKSMLNTHLRQGSIHDTGITPHSSSFAQAGITPPIASLDHPIKQPVTKDVQVGVLAETKNLKGSITQTPKTTRTPVPQTSSSTMNGFIKGAIISLPYSLNTFYCKWKVFRKKTPLLYRIEKSLIIDGDYIHLAPTDDTNWKTGAFDNSFSGGVSQSGHHHHYLHHYNYSKYYSDAMLKTSSFHISQVVKLKQYKDSKNPTHFKIVIKKVVIKKDADPGSRETLVKKKYDLEAESLKQCDEIIEKINWASQLYNSSSIS